MKDACYLTASLPLFLSMIRRVYLEVPGRPHSILRSLLEDPPEGYEVVGGLSFWDRAIALVSSSNRVYYRLHRSILRKVLPVHLLKSLVESVAQRLPPDIGLVYAWGHVVFRKVPWVVEMEWVTQLVDYRLSSFYRWRGLLEDRLVSSYCRRIVCRSEFNRNHIMRNLGAGRLDDKCVVIPQTVRPKQFFRARKSGRTRILYVGSSDVPGGFEQKGGHVLLEAFRHLREQVPSVELVLRSDVPPPLLACRNIPGVRLIEQPISQAELEREFTDADIFAIPAHSTPTVILEAMSYGLPVVTTDVYENAEIIRDGVTGLLIPRSRFVRYFADEGRLMPDFDHPGYYNGISTLDQEMVGALVNRLRLLVKNPVLRRSLGRAAKREIDVGRFSLKRRNDLLGKAFDAAWAPEAAKS